jgi:hypothetical protein
MTLGREQENGKLGRREVTKLLEERKTGKAKS